MENGCGPFERLELTDIDESGREVGRGSYTRVVEVFYKGLRCAAKKVHEKLRQQRSGDLQRRVEAHCTLLSQLRHPCIAQFIGVYFERGSSVPILVMECLPTTLASCLKRSGRLPEELAYAILRDVALGLVYLHGQSPPVVHGDLTANNVLLTGDLTAKITDVGVASMLGVPWEHRSEASRAYAPPEAARKGGQSERKGDCYSVGMLMQNMLMENQPSSVSIAMLNGASNGVNGGLAVPEIDIGDDHPFSSLVAQCTSELPQLRPEASQILSTINEMTLDLLPLSFEDKIELLQVMEDKAGQHQTTPNGGQVSGSGGKQLVRKFSLSSELSQSIEVEQLKLAVEELRVENTGLRTSLAKQQKIMSARDQEMAAKLMAKDQEILSKHQELSARDATVETCKATIAAKEATVEGLAKKLKHVQGYLAKKHEPHLLTPRAQLKWRQCAHLPNAMVFAQAVAIGETVYFGSGTSTIGEAPTDCPYKIFKYESTQNKWSPIPECPVVGFGMADFMGRLTLVGGAYGSPDDSSSSPCTLTNEIHTLEETGEWKKLIPPMPTARLLPTAFSHGPSLVSCGGIVLDASHDVCVRTVEVFSSENSQWYRASPLPLACIGMTSTIIRDHCYLLGGFTDTEFDHPTKLVYTASLSMLVRDAQTRQRLLNGGIGPSPSHIWQSFPEAPRYASTAAHLGGCLLALGGSDERLEHKSRAVHVYSPLTDSWIRIEDIPVECFACAVARLPAGDIILIGGMGHDEEDALKTVYRGRICVD